jgi:hypothetical protein
MSKLKQVEINLDLNEEVHNWKLVREGDGLTKTSSKVKWIEWNEDGRAKDSHDTPAVGYSLIMSPLNHLLYVANNTHYRDSVCRRRRISKIQN